MNLCSVLCLVAGATISVLGNKATKTASDAVKGKIEELFGKNQSTR